MSQQKQKESPWQKLGLRIAVNTASHPIEYAKVLIQIGHEPIPPIPSSSLFGKPVLKLPNIFQYVRHIKSVDGFVGCYRGLTPKLCGNIVSSLATQAILEKLDIRKEERDSVDEQYFDESSDIVLTDYQVFVRDLKFDLTSRFSTIMFSHPFHVITVRMMAQFVGGENRYGSMVTSVTEIYKENGVLGFFSGLVPRLLGDLLSILLANTLSYAVCTYLIDETELKLYTSATISFLANALTYPFQVVANCMTVSGCGLTAGTPPYMPVYTSWVDCWANLSQKNQLKRGSSLFIRHYTGPQVVINGRALPLTKDKLLKLNY